MDPQEFEVRYREQVNDILNRLQTAVAASTQLETTIADIGHAVQRLSREVEQFLADQRSEPRDSSSP
jgi:ABC-type transporter Mla subunit MlaD